MNNTEKNVLLADKTFPFSGFDFNFFKKGGEYFANISKKKGEGDFPPAAGRGNSAGNGSSGEYPEK